MIYTYINQRYGTERRWTYDSLDEALEEAWRDIEYNESRPLELYEGETLLYGQRDGYPLNPGSCPLSDAAHAWAKARGLE